MPVRTNGGVFCDQVLTGSLQHFRVFTADFSGAIDAFGQPLQGSAAEIIFTQLSTKATIAIMNPITNTIGISFALETNRADWTAAEIEVYIQSLGNDVGIDHVDCSTLTVEHVYYNLLPTGTGASTFLELTDTPASYAGAAGQTVVVNGTEDGLIFVPGGGGGAVTSVFGRVGIVIAVEGDYDIGQLGDVDTTTNPPAVGEVLVWDGANFVPGAAGVTTFIALTDTPASYAGAAGQVPVVNGGETALEFVNFPNASPVTLVDINGQPTVVYLDTVRTKTLSVSENPIMFSDNRLDDLNWLRIGDATDADSGYIADFDGTLTYATGQCEDANTFSKDIHVYINGIDNGSIGTLGPGSDVSFINTTIDIDFNRGDKIRLRAVNGIDGRIEDTVIKLVMKWRS